MRHTAATRLVISIHVLREEDDLARMFPVLIRRNFYPRPPRGGRRADAADVGGKRAISIHVLREEDDEVEKDNDPKNAISIHVLREEDDESGHGTDRKRPISIHVLREEDDLRHSRDVRQ